jgi:hypothetical protein
MKDDILRQDQAFAVKKGEKDETEETEIGDDLGLDLKWRLGEERIDVDLPWKAARERFIEILNQFEPITGSWFQPNSRPGRIRMAVTSQQRSVAFHCRSW